MLQTPVDNIRDATSNHTGLTVPLPVGSWQQWSKKLSADSAAVLIMNNAAESQSVTLSFNMIPTFLGSGASQAFTLRDVWAHGDLGSFSNSWTVVVDSHDSAFLVVTKA